VILHISRMAFDLVMLFPTRRPMRVDKSTNVSSDKPLIVIAYRFLVLLKLCTIPGVKEDVHHMYGF